MTTRERINRLLGEYNYAKKQAEQETIALEQAKEKVTSTVQAQQIVQQVAEKVQEHTHQQIAPVVTRCLKAVFGENGYEFKINFHQKRSKTEAELVFVRDEYEMDPLEESGHGACDIASFALRQIALVLSQPPHRRILILDEPFRNVHGTENRKRAASLLKTISKEMTVQVIMTTGFDWLKTGKVVELDS